MYLRIEPLDPQSIEYKLHPSVVSYWDADGGDADSDADGGMGVGVGDGSDSEGGGQGSGVGGGSDGGSSDDMGQDPSDMGAIGTGISGGYGYGGDHADTGPAGEDIGIGFSTTDESFGGFNSSRGLDSTTGVDIGSHGTGGYGGGAASESAGSGPGASSDKGGFGDLGGGGIGDIGLDSIGAPTDMAQAISALSPQKQVQAFTHHIDPTSAVEELGLLDVGLAALGFEKGRAPQGRAQTELGIRAAEALGKNISGKLGGKVGGTVAAALGMTNPIGMVATSILSSFAAKRGFKGLIDESRSTTTMNFIDDLANDRTPGVNQGPQQSPQREGGESVADQAKGRISELALGPANAIKSGMLGYDMPGFAVRDDYDRTTPSPHGRRY